jgi:hypothetical protein
LVVVLPNWAVVFALSTEQFFGLRPPLTTVPAVLEGPGLYDEASKAVAGYYT